MKKVLFIAAGIIILGIAYYGLSPPLRNVEVNDEWPPIAESQPPASEQPPTSGQPPESVRPPAAEGPGEAEVIFCTQEAKQCPDGSYVGRTGPKCEFAACPTSAAPAPVIGTPLHPASGTARVVEAESGKHYLRYENFKTINGPDLFVYLAKDLDATEFVNLGELRGTEGNINYEIPAGVNLTEYPYALTWCRQFSVLFNSD